jgi:hypothetical protein
MQKILELTIGAQAARQDALHQPGMPIEERRARAIVPGQNGLDLCRFVGSTFGQWGLRRAGPVS